MDVVVLACTHFRLLADELQAAIPQRVCLVDGAEGIARRIAVLTRGHAWPEARARNLAIFTGAQPTGALLTALAGLGLDEVMAL
jgi:glutamate racemase